MKLSIGQAATLACLLEATAPKVGNVHRGADFEALFFADFVTSAVAIGPVLERARETGVGKAVFEAIAATRALVDTNTNLGMVLLLARLAAVPPDQKLTDGTASVLQGLTHRATASSSIKQSVLPSLVGREQLTKWMSPALHRRACWPRCNMLRNETSIARQYVDHFALVLQEILPNLVAGQEGAAGH